MPANEYKLITESQNAWKISADKDRKLIDKYVTEKDGTMYIPLSADYHKIITNYVELIKNMNITTVKEVIESLDFTNRSIVRVVSENSSLQND